MGYQWIALRILLLTKHDLINEFREEIISILSNSMIVSRDLIKGIDLSSIDLSNANLEGANLEGVNLSKANLERTNLIRSNLRDANITNSRLYSTKFSYANLSNAKLSGANGLEVELNNADLTNTDFSNFNSNFPKEDHKRYHINFIFDLYNANLSHANFSNVDLGSSMIINLQSYIGLVINEATNFSYSIIDEIPLIDYIQKHTKNIPKKISNKKELQKMLRGVGYSSTGAEPFLDISKLPEE